jgi:hypothetical protein
MHSGRFVQRVLHHWPAQLEHHGFASAVQTLTQFLLLTYLAFTLTGYNAFKLLCLSHQDKVGCLLSLP